MIEYGSLWYNLSDWSMNHLKFNFDSVDSVFLKFVMSQE